MNFREIKKVNELIDEAKKIDSLIRDIQSPFRKIWVSTNDIVVTIKKEHKTKVIQVLLEIRGELEELGVTEE